MHKTKQVTYKTEKSHENKLNNNNNDNNNKHTISLKNIRLLTDTVGDYLIRADISLKVASAQGKMLQPDTVQ